MALTTLLRSQGSAYAPTVLFNTLDTLLVDQASQAISNGIQSIASATLTDMTGMSITLTVETGDMVEDLFSCTYSTATAGTITRFALVENGVVTSADFATEPVDNQVFGRTEACARSHLIVSPATGSVTYKWQFARNAAGAAGTVYTDHRHMSVKVFRRS